MVAVYGYEQVVSLQVIYFISGDASSQTYGQVAVFSACCFRCAVVWVLTPVSINYLMFFLVNYLNLILLSIFGKNE